MPNRREPTEANVRHIQRLLNKFNADHKGLGHPQLRVDGELGHHTKQAIHHAKIDLGYRRKHASGQHWGEWLEWRLQHPYRHNPKMGATHEVLKRAKKARHARRRAVRRNRFRGFLKPGVGSFDGKPVAKTAIPLLTWARANGWDGVLVSGWRDPKYSQSLCFRMCGAPSCPGRCAGLSSNHVGNTPTKFAMDVSDYVRFGQLMARCPILPHVHNALGSRDPVHFSPSGR